MKVLNKDRLNKVAKDEMMRQVKVWGDKYNLDMYSNIIYTLRKFTESKGDAWGYNRLHEFFCMLAENYTHFTEGYDFEDTYAEQYHLRHDCGIDMEEWMKEFEGVEKNA